MKSASLINLCLFLIFLACSDDDASTPVVADFDVAITGEAPNASVNIVNKSSGATNFSWVLSEGSAIDKSILHTPASFIVETKGEITIELTASNGSEEDIIYKTFIIY